MPTGGVLPEGTTSNGLQLLPFHANLLQAAISAHAQCNPLHSGLSTHTAASPAWHHVTSTMTACWIRCGAHCGSLQLAPVCSLARCKRLTAAHRRAGQRTCAIPLVKPWVTRPIDSSGQRREFGHAERQPFQAMAPES